MNSFISFEHSNYSSSRNLPPFLMHWRGAETHEEGTQRKIKLYQFQHYLTGQNHSVEADPSVRKVKEVEVGNHKILTYRLHLWSQLLVAVVLLHCNCQILFGYYGGVFFLELSFSDVLGFLLSHQPWCIYLVITTQFLLIPFLLFPPLPMLKTKVL